MTGKNQNVPVRFIGRFAGFAYILIILLSLFKVSFVEARLVVSGDMAATAGNILENLSLFRAGFAAELLLYLMVIMLSLALCFLTRDVNRDLALLALFMRFGEGIAGIVISLLSSSLPLLLLQGETAVDPNQVHMLAGVFLGLRMEGLKGILILVGLGGAIFFFLFHRSRSIPRLLSCWGMVTCVSMVILVFINILCPARPGLLQTGLFSAGALFEMVVGFWFILKGVRAQPV